MRWPWAFPLAMDRTAPDLRAAYLITFHSDDQSVVMFAGEVTCKHANGATEAPVQIATPVNMGLYGHSFVTCSEPSTLIVNVIEVKQTGRAATFLLQ